MDCSRWHVNGEGRCRWEGPTITVRTALRSLERVINGPWTSATAFCIAMLSKLSMNLACETYPYPAMAVCAVTTGCPSAPSVLKQVPAKTLISEATPPQIGMLFRVYWDDRSWVSRSWTFFYQLVSEWRYSQLMLRKEEDDPAHPLG